MPSIDLRVTSLISSHPFTPVSTSSSQPSFQFLFLDIPSHTSFVPHLHPSFGPPTPALSVDPFPSSLLYMHYPLMMPLLHHCLSSQPLIHPSFSLPAHLYIFFYPCIHIYSSLPSRIFPTSHTHTITRAPPVTSITLPWWRQCVQTVWRSRD